MNTPQRLTNVSSAERRSRIALAVARTAAAWVIFIGIYYFIPFNAKYSYDAIIRLGIGVLIFAAIIYVQIRHIQGSDVPELRAIESIGTIVPFFLVIFAGTYIMLSHASQSNFNVPLNHTNALYFTITVLSTVGFGDITPQRDISQIIVSVQMLFDLLVIVSVVRLLITTARSSVT
jgi:hypothetical protein